MWLYTIYKIKVNIKFVFSIETLSFDSHTTLNNNYIWKVQTMSLLEFGNFIKWDSISNVVFFLFYILGDHLITIDTAELLWSKNISVILGWKFCWMCSKRTTDFETDYIHEVDDLYNTTDCETDENLLEDELKKRDTWEF